jgi:hypothetical protein
MIDKMTREDWMGVWYYTQILKTLRVSARETRGCGGVYRSSVNGKKRGGRRLMLLSFFLSSFLLSCPGFLIFSLRYVCMCVVVWTGSSTV